MEGLIGDGERGEAVIENSGLELERGLVEGLEELIGDGERGEAGEHCKLGGLRVRRRIALFGSSQLPRRHVATSPREWPALRRYAVMRLRT